ncbi:hypothetical protein SVA_2272 [Sulfurifustis variabilis]|uniref:Uncharacterized protein n=1 Tax=Sulfurifustis variabilis TaxID=1675686 RepID=A0A1B4V869_9GAMM|nr:hypothetical protein [Sulfurifustis variabilis]BAU48822.1 hypothetical protein SVA_2272 [Sulfurifustis variabilis]
MHPIPVPCPVCGAAADSATGRCLCPDARPAVDSGSPHLLAKAESLFESYLAARVVHARRRAREAKVAFLREPRNREKGEALRHADREAALLEMQLVEQTRKAQQARDAARNLSPTPAAPSAPTASGSPPSPSASSANRADAGHRECPRCAARVPGAVAECRCGYEFAPADAGAGQVLLSEGDLRVPRGGRAK